MLPDKPVVGKYILDSLSIGMYNHPLMLIREYIQNSTDAIDEYRRDFRPSSYRPRIEITISGRTRAMTIRDNGAGVPGKQAWKLLHDLGNSRKKLNQNRGFRGIGRLGGLGYCDQLSFRTKYDNESLITISTWDCKKLRELIKLENDYDTNAILSAVITYKQEDYEGEKKKHFFEVEMNELSGSRQILLNVPLIKSYVSEVGPVPFNKNTFSFADRIEKTVRWKIRSYETYQIEVNGEQIYKPYSNRLQLRGDHKDNIRDVKFVELRREEKELAFGWIAETQLLGTISSLSHVDGLRVRKDNILIGDKSLLNGLFRESRFNNYLAGELYAIDDQLIPNSRRDDFEDNESKEDFYESFIKAIGLPISKRIRQVSQERTMDNALKREQRTIEEAKNILDEGYLAEYQKNAVIRKLRAIKFGVRNEEEIKMLVQGIQGAKHYLDTKRANGSRRHKKLLKPVFETLYKEHEDKEVAIKIIRKILMKMG